MKHEGWTPELLSPAERQLLDRYEELLRGRAVPRGLISTADAGELRSRHILDSLRAVPYLPPSADVCDLGSGAGLPGIPVAIARPDLNVTLVESRRARTAFLELAVDALELPNATVFPGPVEELTEEADACLARGFADAPRTWARAKGLLRPGGRLLYWAGATFSEQEVPIGIPLELVADATLESGGPIAIMTRQ